MGKIAGNPDNIAASIKPSSYDEWYLPGEHGFNEPGVRADDTADRIEQTQAFVAGKYHTLLIEQWWPKCFCICTEAWGE